MAVKEMTEGEHLTNRIYGNIIGQGYRLLANAREDEIVYWKEKYSEKRFEFFIGKRAFHSDGKEDSSLRAIFIKEKY